MSTQSQGFRGVVLRALGAKNFQLTVRARQEITANYVRLSFLAGDLLAARPVHPTAWARVWFPAGDRTHMRAYSLINPDLDAGTIDIEFALHSGPASRWARDARHGDTIAAMVSGSRFDLPTPAPDGYLIVGDTASLPAINTLLSHIADTPARVLLEWQHDEDRNLPVHVTPRTDLTWIRRERGGAALPESLARTAFDASRHFGWVACDSITTRSVETVLREQYRMERKSIKARAYWWPTGA